jgi:hypothetical protein
MIMVVMIGMSVVFAYVSAYASNYKAGVGSSVLESLTIEDIFLKGSGVSYNNQVTFWVYNAGKIDATINAIYINGIAATNGSSTFNFKISVPRAEHVPITVTSESNWQTGAHYEFKITTLRGSNFVGSIDAP